MQKRKILVVLLLIIILLMTGFLLWQRVKLLFPSPMPTSTPTPAPREISLALVKEYDTGLAAFGKQVSSGNHIYFTHLAGGGMQLAVLDVLDIFNPKKVYDSTAKAFMFPSEEVETMYLRDNFLYISGSTVTDQVEMDVYDVLDPSEPKFVWFEDELIYQIEISNDYLFLLGSKFLIYDISNPAKPVLLFTRETNDIGTEAMCISGDYVYTGGIFKGISIIDVQDKKNPILVGKDEGATEDLFCIGNIIYQMGGSSLKSSKDRFIVLDAADPMDIKMLKSFRKEELKDFYQIGNNLFVAYKNGVLIFDISNTANPVLLKDITGDFGLISGREKYLYSLISDPSKPRNSILKIYEIKYE